MAWFVCQRQASRERSKINAVDTCVSGKVLLVKGSTSLHHYLHLCRFDEADTDTEGAPAMNVDDMTGNVLNASTDLRHFRVELMFAWVLF